MGNKRLSRQNRSEEGDSISNYQILETLVESAFGSVHKVISKTDHWIYVLKQIDSQHMNREQKNQAYTEYKIMQKV